MTTINIIKPVTFGVINDIKNKFGVDLLKVLEPNGLDFFSDTEKVIQIIAYMSSIKFEELMENPDFTIPVMEEATKEILTKLADFFPPVQGTILKKALQSREEDQEKLQEYMKVIEQILTDTEIQQQPNIENT